MASVYQQGINVNLFKGSVRYGFPLAALAVLLLIGLSPSQDPTVSGVLLPSVHARSASSSDQIVFYKALPPSATVLGYINIERQYPVASLPPQAPFIKAAKTMAKSVGANGIVIDSFEVGTVTRGHQIYIFKARAVHSPKGVL